MTWRSALGRTTAVVALAVAISGCLPNRGAVSPDGRTFYFSLNKKAGFDVDEGSNIYALDVESGRLKALTDVPEMKGWCTATSDGKFLVYGTLAVRGGTVAALDLERGRTLPITGVTQNYWCPWALPGSPLYVVAAFPKSNNWTQWVLVGEHGDVPLGPLADYNACGGNVGLAPTRFAVAGGRQIKDGDKETCETVVWVVDLSNPPEAKGEEESAAPPAGEARPAEGAKAESKAAAAPAKPWPVFTCAAKWTDIGGKEGGPRIDLAFSADGKRLVAAVNAGKDQPARFFDLDTAGKEQPKLLFEVPGGCEPQLAPDGSGIVYLRLTGDNEGREALLWRPDLKEPRVIARLPGKFGEAFTTCFWMKEGGLRIYHVCGEGLWLVEAAADGTGAKAQHLPRERMAAQKYLADFERGLGHVPDAPPENLPEPLAGAVKAVGQPLHDAAEPVQDALEGAWAAASVWEEVAPLGQPAAAGQKP